MARIEYIATLYPKSSGFGRYMRSGIFPPMDTQQLLLSFLVGDDRRALKTPTTGDVSLLLAYKAKEGAISSFGVADRDLQLMQLQGARSSRAFRVATGVYWIDLMADEAVSMAKHRRSDIKRLTMPKPAMIKGIEHAVSELVVNRYHEFATRAELRWSQDDLVFARDF